jgi:hypothetical protein
MIRQVEQAARQAERLLQQATQVRNDAMKYWEHLDTTTIFIINIANKGNAFYE